jgi:hypothetical protein
MIGGGGPNALLAVLAVLVVLVVFYSRVCLWAKFLWCLAQKRGRLTLPGISRKRARTMWLTERIASMGNPHEGPIQTTKTHARVSAREAVGKLRRKRFGKKLDVQRFFT